jgi:hypothetical protein
VKHFIIALCFGLVVGTASTSYAEYSPYGNKSLFFRINAISYSDINLATNSGNTTGAKKYDNAYEFKMGVQVRNMYYITATALTSENHTHESYGGGVKIRLPGFFLLGGSVLDLFSKKEASRLQTFISYSLLDTTLKASTGTQKYIENVFALNIHVRIFNDVFLSGEGSLRAFLGDHVYAYGGGLGFGF